QLGPPGDVSFDPAGTLFVADPTHHRVLRIAPIVPATGAARWAAPAAISVFAGSGTAGFDADVALAPTAKFSSPAALLAYGAGSGQAGPAGIGQAATSAELAFPQGIDVAADGRVLIADSANHRVVAVGTDGRLQLVAGTGVTGDDGDGGPATDAQLAGPLDVA